MRLFVAFPIPYAARRALAIAIRALEKDVPGRYIDPENAHITVAFLGEVDPETVTNLTAPLQHAVRNAAPVQARIQGLGCFGSPPNAILYAKTDADDALQPIADSVRAALCAQGIRFDEKAFRPHITLARKAAPDASVLRSSLPDTACVIDSIVLYHSTRVNGRLTYIPLERVRFGTTESLLTNTNTEMV